MNFLAEQNIVKKDLTHEDLMSLIKPTDRFNIVGYSFLIRTVLEIVEQPNPNIYEIKFQVYDGITYTIFNKSHIVETKEGFIILKDNKPTRQGFYLIRATYERISENIPRL